MAPTKKETLLDVAKLNLRLLTFRSSRNELLALTNKHLAFGLVCTWMVGIGRYWDNPRVGLLQHLGVGSVVYVFVLALLLWLIIWPLRPAHWSYLTIATFVALVSPPAILYAIPVEKFVGLVNANSINSWFLAIVAVWRVALLIFFLRRASQLDIGSIIVGTFLPMTLIVVALTELNLERAVFSIMGGLHNPTPNDAAFAMLWLLSFLAAISFIPLFFAYLGIIIVKTVAISKRTRKKNENVDH